MNEHEQLIAYVLQHSANEPVRKRITLLRALASIAGDSKNEKTIRELALNLDRADRLCRDFEFSFVQKDKVSTL